MSSKNKATKNAADISLVSSLQQLEGGFLFLVNQAPIVVSIIDKNGYIFYQSPNLKKLLGFEAATRIGKNFIKSKVVHPDDVVIKKQLLEKVFHYPNKNFTDELRLRHQSGTWRWMEVIFNNQLANPAVKGIVVITQDIHERKLFEMQKNEFLSVASHEIRTPLTTIRAYGQLLLKRLSKDKINRQECSFLDNLVSQTDKLTRLIDDLLDVSKLQEGKYSIKLKPFQMQSLVKKLIEDFRHLSDLHKITLIKTTKAFVIGDEDRIGQVMTNLLTNAIKYSPKSPKIHIQIERKGKYVVTSVTDFGEGIPASKQKFVFDRFFRINDRKSPNASTGLGLYIAAEIIKLHKGNIWLQSKKGKGSTFYFSLPISENK